MSQLNFDKLSLLGPQGAAVSFSRQPAAETPGAFNAHLEWASKASAEPPPPPRGPEAPPARPLSSESQRDDPAEAPKPPQAKQDAPQPAESRESRDDEPSADSETAASDPPEETKASESKAARDDDADDDDAQEKEEPAAEQTVAAVIDITGAAARKAGDEPSQEAARSEQVALIGEAAEQDVETGAHPATGQTEAKPKRATSKQPAKSDPSAQVEKAPPAPNEAAENSQPAAIAGGDVQSDDESAGDEGPLIAEKSPSSHEGQTAKSQPRNPDSAKREPGDASAGRATAETAEAAPANEKQTAFTGLSRHEADAAANRPAAASAQGTAEAGEPSAETAAVDDRSGKAAAVKPGSSPTVRSAAPENPNPSQAGQVDRVQFVQRVARAFEAASARGGNVRLRLHPPELGSLGLELKVQHGAMTAKVHAESTAARNLLLDNLPALRDRLAQHDIKIQQFEVDLGLGSSGDSPQGPFGQQQWHDNPAQTHSPAPGNHDAQGDAAAAPPARRSVSDPSQFDVTV